MQSPKLKKKLKQNLIAIHEYFKIDFNNTLFKKIINNTHEKKEWFQGSGEKIKTLAEVKEGDNSII